jgi:hypothetical protein
MERITHILATLAIAPMCTRSEATYIEDAGLGTWTKREMIVAIQTGVRPDGRMLAPIMPWRAYAELTKSDAGAIVD